MWRIAIPVFTFLCGACLGQTPDLVIRIQEERTIGTYIGNVSDSKMFQNVTQSERQTLQFGILNKNNSPGNLFYVDSNSGRVSVRGRIDREVLCVFTEVCRVQFDVAIHSTSNTFSNVATVFVYVEDINDNGPVFPVNDVTLDVSELTSVGTVLKISGAVDLDSMVNNTIRRYEMSRLRDLFSLTTQTNLDGSSVINLKLEKSLDRELTAEHTFNIIALDGGSPPKSGSLAVTINVVDENDNAPQFRNSSYSVSVKEDDPVNSTVLVVVADDPDEGDNGRIHYQFSNLQSSKLQSLFSIDSTTGVIRVAGKLEYETDAPQYLIVEALDSGDSPLKTQAVVTVTVLDSGNNRPVVKINTLAPGNTVSEAADIGFFVAYVEVEDSDTGENGDVSCNISSSDFKLEPLSGRKRFKVLVNGILDREVKSRYNVSVVCQDKGSPPLAGLGLFPIYITDVNDNNPVFTRTRYTMSIPEDSPIGRSVITLMALDKDAGDNAKLRYYVVQNNQRQSFRIEHDKGIITTNRKFDREKEALVKFQVHAVDRGSPPRTGTAEVTLHITDVNDMFPVFDQQLFQFAIRENLPAQTVVGNITAVDKDAGLNGEIEYFIAESPDGIIPFKVLSNGTVIVQESLDRESKSKYIFTVLARDKGSPPKTNSSEVSITVMDENDNVPAILFPTTFNHTVFISRAPERDSVIGKIVAYDPDFAENSSLIFTISTGNTDGAFSIDSKSGETKVSTLWKLQNEKVYDLTITVSDSGTPALSTETHLIIDVAFNNETLMNTPMQSTSDRYVVIAGVVAAATIILSVIIIAAIFFVLRTDRRKSPSSGTGGAGVGSHVSSGKPSASVVISSPVDTVQLQSDFNVRGTKKASQSGVFGSPHHDKQSDGHKKKEVSFSFDDSLDSKPRDIIFSNSKLAFLDDKEKILHLDDVHSDTSAETIPSDSGRGGSEEEMSTQLDKKTHLTRWDAPVQGNKSRSFDQCFPLPGKQNMGFPNSRDNHVRFLHTNSFHEGRESRNQSVSAIPRDMSRDYLMPHGHNTFQDRSHEYSRPLSYRRQPSNMSHDEDCSTTTSGSYTINQDDFLDDRILGKDVIV